MFEKHKVILLISLIFLLFSTAVNGQAIDNYIDKSQISRGIIKVNPNSDKSMALRVSKDNTTYDYILNGNNDFPLQLGNGEYTVLVLENVNGKKYKVIQKDVVILKSDSSKDIYLQSIQLVNWDSEMKAIKKAKELTKDIKSDSEKVRIIYNYIVNNINYDNNKAKQVKSNYIPNIDEILNSKKAICYDYASLFAAMLRSVDVPAKLMMGRKNDIKEYHAWNQVYLNDTDKWVTIDTTYDSAYAEKGLTINMTKDGSQYKIEKEY